MRTAQGLVRGQVLATGVRRYLGVPFAAPPVGARRWTVPEPAPSWDGERTATDFAPRCLQPANSSLRFRSTAAAEDCLYLNTWSPTVTSPTRLPVLVYFHGGGFSAGDGTAPRHDGEPLATRQVVVVTANYRLGVFGFLAHPELSASSPYAGSGNYGMLDQIAALAWVRDNIAQFGGDPEHVTIAGPSAGSEAVTGLMASPMARGLFAGAILSSGALMPPARTVPVALASAERMGVDFSEDVKLSLAEMRTSDAGVLLERSLSYQHRVVSRFPLAIDGHVFREPTLTTFVEGRQARVPVLVGWNSHEQDERAVLAHASPTPRNYLQALQQIFGARAPEALRHYPGETEPMIRASAAALGSDLVMGRVMWKLADTHARTSGQPVFRYLYAHPRPRRPTSTVNRIGNAGAAHGDEIEDAFGTLDSVPDVTWTEADRRVSTFLMQAYVSFIREGQPRVETAWPPFAPDAWPVLHLDAAPVVRSDPARGRYLFLESASPP